MFDLVDGSGLSAWNLVAPRAFVQILSRMRDLPRRRRRSSTRFPIAGETGTLKARFTDARLTGRVRAKTGSINRVNSLSGYLELPRRPDLDLLDPAQQPHRHDARGAGAHRRDRHCARAVSRRAPWTASPRPP